MPRNIETITSSDNPEEIDKSISGRQIGAQVLTTTGFENRQKEIVESSFNKAIKRGEKLPGKNNERRNYAYLSRLENLVDKYGNDLEKKLWDASLDKVHIIQPEDFTQNYWEHVEQGLRDAGHGHKLADWEKKAEIENRQELQRSTLKSWANYLGDEASPYPMWFKVYAWDGMTKMGSYDKNKHSYGKRDRHTTSPYPDCNPEVISSVYGYINDFYNTPEHALYDENNNRDKELEALVVSGNFSKLYALAETEISPIVPTPENPEDIHGEWVAYTVGDERAMATASRGTGWCTKNPSVARSYLRTATYGQIDYDDEYGENDEYRDVKYRNDEDDRKNSKATFWVFHLYDPAHPGKLAQNGCLAILLDSNGNVTNEVRGLGEGEAVEDSLLPTLQEKLETLPGNEAKMAELLDSNALIALDRKMQNNEDLTKEELEFLYEVHRPITPLDTYNDEDPRIDELKEKYNIEYALDKGVDANLLVSRLNWLDTRRNFNALLNHGADINKSVSNLRPVDIANNLDALLNRGADVDEIISHLNSEYVARELDILVKHGADIDIDQLVSELRPRFIAYRLDNLLKHGADIDVNQLVSKLETESIANNLDTLLNHGADPNKLASKLGIRDIAKNKNLDKLLNHGADPNKLASKLGTRRDIAKNLDTLLNHGADINQITSKLSPEQIARNINTLRAHGYQE